MMFLKKEILRIAKAAIEDGGAAQEIIPTFQYENVANEYLRNKKNCFNKVEKEVNKLQNEVSAINRKYDFDEFDIKDMHISEHRHPPLRRLSPTAEMWFRHSKKPKIDAFLLKTA